MYIYICKCSDIFKLKTVFMKKIKVYFLLTIIMLVAGYNVAKVKQIPMLSDIALGEVEALSRCEIKKNGEIIFECRGNEETDCKEKYKAMFFGTLEVDCSGTFVKH